MAQNFLLVFVLSLVFMYLILAAQFESWRHPVTILLSRTLTLSFALRSIIITQPSLNIFSASDLRRIGPLVSSSSEVSHSCFS